MNRFKLVLISMRPKQWAKNLFLFAAITFSLQLLSISLLLKVVGAFLCFCSVSGSVYLLNDIIDRHKDELHPEKSKRPIASGKLDTKTAGLSLFILLLVSLFSALKLGIPFFVITSIYFTLNLFYSFHLKHIVILDVFTIAIGFVLRAIAGAVVITVKISPWLSSVHFSRPCFLHYANAGIN